MEREFDIQPLELSWQRPETAEAVARPGKARLLLLLVLMLLPWVWVSAGLMLVQDYRLTIAMYEVLGCGLPVLLLRPKGLSVRPLRMGMGGILLFAIILNVGILSAFKTTGGFNMDWVYFSQHMQGSKLAVDQYFWLFAFYIVVLNPLFEETFWRGVIYREWKRYVSPWQANLISSFFFGAWHWVVLQNYCHSVWAVILAVLVMIGGVMFAYTYEKTGTLGAPILMHGLGADLPMTFVVFDCIHQALLSGQTPL